MQSSGNEVFLRNPFNVNENLYVTISSPSSSKYTQSDLSSPDATAQTVLKQFLKEYMSTRLGVRREADIVDASLHTGEDQKSYSEPLPPLKQPHTEYHTQVYAMMLGLVETQGHNHT